MNELDIWRAANILLKRYKADAVLIAAKRADAFLEQGDMEGRGVWIRVTRAITELERKMCRPAEGESTKDRPAGVPG
jgi:hypothetical protein